MGSGGGGGSRVVGFAILLDVMGKGSGGTCGGTDLVASSTDAMDGGCSDNIGAATFCNIGGGGATVLFSAVEFGNDLCGDGGFGSDSADNCFVSGDNTHDCGGGLRVGGATSFATFDRNLWSDDGGDSTSIGLLAIPSRLSNA